MRKSLSFDDVQCVPKYTTIRSRSEVDTSTVVAGIKLKIPFISSPMDTVTDSKMAIELGKLGGMGVMHRFLSPEDQILEIKKVYDFKIAHSELTIPVVPSIGVTSEEIERFKKITLECPGMIDLLSIDVANGHSIFMKEAIEKVRKINPNIKIMAGNIATAEGFVFLRNLHVNAVRCGIGSGSICSTRIQTSFGVNVLQTLLWIAEYKQGLYQDTPSIIADGGIRYPMDVVKALVAGADAVMCGKLFAATEESPGELIHTPDGYVKKYRGAASKEVQDELRGGLKPGTCAEGVSTLLPYKGSITDIIQDYVGGLKSGMTYGDAKFIEGLRYVEMIETSNAGLAESHAFGTKKE